MTEREKIVTGTAVSVMMIICFYMFVYQPQKKEALRLKKEIETVDLEIERIVKAIPGLKKLEKEVTREQERGSLVKKATSGEQPMLELLRQLARESYRLDMDVISLGLGEKSEGARENSPYQGLTIVMNIQCPYRQLGSYLKRLSELPGLVTVDGLQIVRDSEIFPKVKVKLTLSTFVSRGEV